MEDVETITFDEFCRLANRSNRAMEKLCRQLELPPHYFKGNDRMFSKHDCKAWLETNGACRTARELNVVERHFKALN